MKRIQFYRRNNGSSPIVEFLDKLPAKDTQKVIWVLKLIEEIDQVPGQYMKKLTGTDEIWEIRIHFSGKQYRLLGFLDGNELVILTNGFSKKSPKVPKKEIRLAEERKIEFMQRKKHE